MLYEVITIEYIERTPDTSIAMLSGKRVIVREGVQDVLSYNFV